MPIRYSTITNDDVEELCELDGRNFGFRFKPEHVDHIRNSFDFSRFLAARDGDTMVGAAGNFSLELTLPGPNPVPMAGVTWVSVSPTHRRQGIASELMARLDADAREHGEALIGLTASEGAIYERFGYGTATVVRSTTVDRRRVEMLERFRGDTSVIRLVDHTEHFAEICAIHDRYRRGRVGEVSLPEWLARDLYRASPSDVVTCALHPDGFAIWSTTQDWNDGDPRHGLRLWALAAVTDEAYRALWTLLLSIDLAGEISARSVLSPDEPLPYLLTNPRALKTTHIGDSLWLKVLDPAAAFAARGYRTSDSFVIELADGSRLRVSDKGVGRAGRRRPDLTLFESAVGPLLLGGVSASVLASGGRLVPRSPETLARADAFFGVSPTPHFGHGF